MARTINAGENVKRSDTFFVDPREILVDWELNGRHDTFTPEAIARLAVDMQQNGQLQPVACRSMPEKRVQLIYGYNRLRAALEIVKRDPNFRLEIKVYDGLNDKDSFLMNVRENMIRNEVSAIDNGYNIRKLVNQFGFAVAEVAELYKRSTTWVTDTLKLLTLPEPVKDKIQAGDLAASTGLILSRLPAEEAQAALEEAIEQVQAEQTPAEEEAPAPLPLTVDDESLKDAISALPARPKSPKDEKEETPEQAKTTKASRRARLSAAVEQAAAARGAQVARTAADLKKLIGKREDELSRLLVAYLGGTAAEEELLDALDRSESPVFSNAEYKKIRQEKEEAAKGGKKGKGGKKAAGQAVGPVTKL